MGPLPIAKQMKRRIVVYSSAVAINFFRVNQESSKLETIAT